MAVYSHSGPAFPARAVTAAATLSIQDYLILANAASAAFTLTLPAANAHTGKILLIKRTNSGANDVTVARAGSDTIDGATSVVLYQQWESVTLMADGGTAWSVIARSAEGDVTRVVSGGSGTGRTIYVGTTEPSSGTFDLAVGDLFISTA